MSRNAAAPLTANILNVGKGSARPFNEAEPPSTERRFGLTVRLSETQHRQLRALAFEQDSTKGGIVEAWILEKLAKFPQS